MNLGDTSAQWLRDAGVIYNIGGIQILDGNEIRCLSYVISL